MKIEPLDQTIYGGKIYGYCDCGREVQKDKDKVCPLCGKTLIWEGENEQNDKN